MRPWPGKSGRRQVLKQRRLDRESQKNGELTPLEASNRRCLHGVVSRTRIKCLVRKLKRLSQEYTARSNRCTDNLPKEYYEGKGVATLEDANLLNDLCG
jgi:hypothetical protein